jgi:hypothetical protein
MKTIVTEDKTWIYGYDVETKAQSSQWLGQGSLRPKKTRMSRSNMKVMLVDYLTGLCNLLRIRSTWSDSKQEVLCRSSEVFEGSRTPE